MQWRPSTNRCRDQLSLCHQLWINTTSGPDQSTNCPTNRIPSLPNRPPRYYNAKQKTEKFQYLPPTKESTHMERCWNFRCSSTRPSDPDPCPQITGSNFGCLFFCLLEFCEFVFLIDVTLSFQDSLQRGQWDERCGIFTFLLSLHIFFILPNTFISLPDHLDPGVGWLPRRRRPCQVWLPHGCHDGGQLYLRHFSTAILPRQSWPGVATPSMKDTRRPANSNGGKYQLLYKSINNYRLDKCIKWSTDYFMAAHTAGECSY